MAGLAVIGVLILLSAAGAFRGAEKARQFFNSAPLKFYWCIFAILFATGFVEFPGPNHRGYGTYKADHPYLIYLITPFYLFRVNCHAFVTVKKIFAEKLFFVLAALIPAVIKFAPLGNLQT